MYFGYVWVFWVIVTEGVESKVIALRINHGKMCLLIMQSNPLLSDEINF